MGQYLPPQYPQNALERGIEGSVTIEATIGKLGKVISVKVLKSSNNKSLDNAAIKWFLNLKFTPAKTGKTPEKSVIIQKIKFNIKD
ncbi:energy transducer TonB [Paraphotobacterium marinum]|uniref:energy transducer TonB n=1 Tax=Paraphotobacterium marinum TaxID=1755811 RepID=UPI001CEFA493